MRKALAIVSAVVLALTTLDMSRHWLRATGPSLLMDVVWLGAAVSLLVAAVWPLRALGAALLGLLVSWGMVRGSLEIGKQRMLDSCERFLLDPEAAARNPDVARAAALPDLSFEVAEITLFGQWFVDVRSEGESIGTLFVGGRAPRFWHDFSPR